MNILHATLNTCDPFGMTRVSSPLEAFNALRRATSAFATQLIMRVRHRWTMRSLDRFSDHRLRDLGFERDWGGSVIPAASDR